MMQKKDVIYRVAEQREKQSISIEKLSKNTNIDLERLKLIEENEIIITVDEMKKIAEFLKIRQKDLYYTVEDYNKVRQLMYDSIEENGIAHKETLRLSNILDKLQNIIEQNC